MADEDLRFKTNPSTYVDLNDLFPVLNEKVGLSYEQWRVAIENCNYLKNHLGVADVEVGETDVIVVDNPEDAKFELSTREETVGDRTIIYLDSVHYVPAGKVKSVNGQTGDVNLTYADVGALSSQYATNISNLESDVSSIQENVSTLDTDLNLVKEKVEGLQVNSVQQVLEMPNAGEDYLNSVVVFVGETNTSYVKGDMYKCHKWTDNSLPPTVNRDKYFWVDLNNELAIMPNSAQGYENRIVRYIGETNENYTYGKFYEWYYDSSLTGYGGRFKESTIYATADDILSAVGNVSALLGNTEDLEV